MLWASHKTVAISFALDWPTFSFTGQVPSLGSHCYDFAFSSGLYWSSCFISFYNSLKKCFRSHFLNISIESSVLVCSCSGYNTFCTHWVESLPSLNFSVKVVEVEYIEISTVFSIVYAVNCHSSVRAQTRLSFSLNNQSGWTAAARFIFNIIFSLLKLHYPLVKCWFLWGIVPTNIL